MTPQPKSCGRFRSCCPWTAIGRRFSMACMLQITLTDDDRAIRRRHCSSITRHTHTHTYTQREREREREREGELSRVPRIIHNHHGPVANTHLGRTVLGRVERQLHFTQGGSVAEWLACWTQAQKGPGSNRSRDAVLGKLFTPIVPLFTKQQNW